MNEIKWCPVCGGEVVFQRDSKEIYNCIENECDKSFVIVEI